MKRAAVTAFVCLFSASVLADLPSSFKDDVATIQAIGSEGAGNPEAAAAWKSLARANGEAIVPLLEAMDESGPVPKNMIRSAVEVISEKEQAAGRKLPVSELQGFVLNTEGNPHARRMAFDLLAGVDPQGADKLIPGFINDPAVSLRRKAVERAIAAGNANLKEDKAAAVKIFREALDAARDVDQINEITTKLRDQGEAVDLPRHFGFLMDWKMIAPFDNTDRKGFAEVFPPEKEVDLEATYEGKDGAKVSWVDFTSTNEYGMIDFNKPFSPMKKVVGYAFTEFESSEERPVELRLGCKNAWKVWFNGELLFGRDEYHRGARIDQYLMPVQLKKGKNTILVKACQNETDESWTVQWEFQLRVCDSTGTAVLANNRKPTAKEATQPAKK